MKQICSVVIVIFIVSLIGVSTTSGQEKVGEINHANISPLSGPAAPWGVAASRAYEMAAEAVGIFEVGGKKYKYKLLDYDTKYNPADALSALNKAVYTDNAKYGQIMGAGVQAATLPLINESGFLNMTIIGGGKEFTNPNNFTEFRIMASSDQLIITFYEIVYRDFKVKRVALLVPNDPYGKSESALYAKLHREKPIGTDLVITEFYERGTADFYPVLKRILANNVGLIITGGSPTGSAALIAKQSRELGFKGYLYNVSGVLELKTMVDTAGAAADNYIVPRIWGDPPKKYVELAERYKKRYGEEMLALFPEVYAAIPWLTEAFKKAKTLDTKVVAGVLADIPFSDHPFGPAVWCGEKYFGIKRNIGYPIPLSIIRNGKWVQLTTKSGVID